MPRNVEVKARVRDPGNLQRRLQALAVEPAAVLAQRDVFFGVAQGRLKVRFEAGHAELIAYHRRDEARLHLDRVTGLGDFLEIEAIVDEEHDEAACHAAAQQLLQDLGIAAPDLETQAYVDMLSAD